MKKSIFLPLIFLLMTSLIGSQSLVEMAKKEKKRRESLKGKKSIVLTNSHLKHTKKGGAIEIPPAPAKKEPVDQKRVPAAAPQRINVPTVRSFQPNSVKSVNAEPENPQKENDLEGKYKKAEELVALLTLKMNSLWQEYYSMDDMSPRDNIQKQISETYTKLLEAKKEAEKAKADYERSNSRRQKK